jgi:c-di-GMP-related signal transduction protein
MPAYFEATGGADTALYVARQPILDERGRVFGYELLYRGAPGDTACTIDGNLASARVLTGALLDVGLETLTNGHRAFLNVTRALLLGHIDRLVQPDGIVIELLESVEVDQEVVEACRELRAKGYRLALDDFVVGSDAEALLPYVAYVKVDVLATPLPAMTTLAARLAPTGVALLAEKVESRDVFEQTRKAGYSLFQGYYFCRPVIQTGVALPSQHLAYLRLLTALSKPQLTNVELERLVKQDVSLSMRVLRSVNSAAYPIRTEVRSIGQALVMLGIDPIRKWASVWCLAGLTKGATPELATLALVRARTCELLGEQLPDAESSELFLVGLFSLLDVMLSRNITDALEGLPLSHEAITALQGRPNVERTVLDAVIAFERAKWDVAEEAAGRAGLNASVLSEAYTQALRWTKEVARSGVI